MTSPADPVIAQLRQRLQHLRERICSAAQRAGRPAASCQLLAVVKTVPDELVQALIELGQKEVAENRVQALRARPEHLQHAGAWHLIGNLQTNKARLARRLFACFHALDRAHLAAALGAGADAEPWPVFLQVNVASEPQKHGCAPADLPALVAAVRAYPGLWIRGLMAMAPLDPDPEHARPHFRALRELSERLRSQGILPAGAAELSMGMTQDYEVAVEEGATLVRIGSALFTGLDAAPARG